MKKPSFNLVILLAAFLGIITGLTSFTPLIEIAENISELFIRLLRLVSSPIIFFALLSTLTGMKNILNAASLFKKVLRYTLFTTMVAASVALVLFVIIDPSSAMHDAPHEAVESTKFEGYTAYLMHLIPTNFISPFIDNQVISVLLLALMFSMAVLSLPERQRGTLSHLFECLFAAIMSMTGYILKLMPLAVWAFITNFFQSVGNEEMLESLSLYIICLIAANMIQALVVLPLCVYVKGVNPLTLFKGVLPALTVAFFSKSSSAALPTVIENLEKNVGLDGKITRFTLPLCITINMNACAAFILITVLFVSTVHDYTYTTIELIGWVFIATLAAVGNAGVPMGCYLITTTILVSMKIPLNVMGVILPVYALIDMLESAINVWSDSCVTSMIDKDMKNEKSNMPVMADRSC